VKDNQRTSSGSSAQHLHHRALRRRTSRRATTPSRRLHQRPARGQLTGTGRGAAAFTRTVGAGGRQRAPTRPPPGGTGYTSGGCGNHPTSTRVRPPVTPSLDGDCFLDGDGDPFLRRVSPSLQVKVSVLVHHLGDFCPPGFRPDGWPSPWRAFAGGAGPSASSSPSMAGEPRWAAAAPAAGTLYVETIPQHPVAGCWMFLFFFLLSVSPKIGIQYRPFPLRRDRASAAYNGRRSWPRPSRPPASQHRGAGPSRGLPRAPSGLTFRAVDAPRRAATRRCGAVVAPIGKHLHRPDQEHGPGPPRSR